MALPLPLDTLDVGDVEKVEESREVNAKDNSGGFVNILPLSDSPVPYVIRCIMILLGTRDYWGQNHEIVIAIPHVNSFYASDIWQ